MIHIGDHDFARQRQQELLARAERNRLARIARDENASGRTGYYKKLYAALRALASGNSLQERRVTDWSDVGAVAAAQQRQ